MASNSASNSDGSLPRFLRLEPLKRLLALGRRNKPLWFYPSLALLLGLLLGLLLSRFDTAGDSPLSFLVYEGDPESARDFVTLAASSVATITSLTLTITVVTLQLASTQYSPRLIEHYLDDRGIRSVISLFLLTIAFAVAVLLNVRLPDDAQGAAGQVPGPAISLLIVLLGSCLAALVFFVYRVTQSIRVEAILKRVRDRTIESIRERSKHDPSGEQFDEIPDPPVDGDLVRSRRTGFFVDLDRDVLDQCDADGDARVWILVSPGEFVTTGMPVAIAIHFDDDEVDDEVEGWLMFDTERWIEADYSFGVRSIADVAIKALSPGINDPTTASMAVQRIAEVMAVAATTRGDRALELGGGGVVFVPIRAWEHTLDELLDQIAHYGRDDTQVVIELIRLLRSLAWVDGDVDRTDELRTACDRLARLVDVERSSGEQALVDREFDLLERALDGDATGLFNGG